MWMEGPVGSLPMNAIALPAFRIKSCDLRELLWRQLARVTLETLIHVQTPGFHLCVGDRSQMTSLS